MIYGARGLALIEIMIVLTIIAVLAAIAVPAYQAHAARSQLAAGLAEIRAGKTNFESRVLADNLHTFDLADIGLPANTPRCAMSMVPGLEGYIRCTLKGSPLIAGKTIQLVRTASSEWACKVDAGIDESLLPVGCTH